MGRPSEPELSNGPLSPTSSSSSDELPDASLLSRRKRQLAVAQRRRSSMSGPPSLGTNHSNQGEESAVRHASSGVPSNGFQASGQSASGGAFPCRRLSWRQQNGRSAGDDVSEPGNESIESIPRAEWTRGRRPSWRRLSSTDANVQKLDTEEKQPSMQLESGGAVCRGGKAAGAEQVPERTAGDVHRSEGGGASKEKEDSPGMGLLESERQGGASFADETVLVAGQRDSTEVGSAERQFPEGDEGKEERGRLGSKESNSGGTGLRAEAAAVSGRSASIGGDGPNGRYGSEETNEADMEYSAVESNEIEGPTEGHGVEEDATQRGEDRNNRKEEETELAPERPEKRQTEKPVLGTVRRRSVNIAELKRLAAVEVRSRRGSESDVTIQQPTEGDGISQVDGTQRVESREAAERPLVLDVTNGSRDGQAGALSASVAAKVPAKEDARAAVPAREGRSGGESWQQEETRSEGTSKKLEEGGGEEPQEEEGGEATEDDRGASAQKRSKRRTSADLLKGDWLTKAREIGEPDWVAPTETARGVNRGDAGGGIKCGVEKRGGGEEKAVVKKVESTHVGGTANGGVFVERREEGQERLGAREKESTREDGAGSGTDSQASGKRATDKRITPSVFAKEDERGATGVPIIFPAEAQGIPQVADEAALQARIRAEVDAAVQSAAATWQASLGEKLLDRTRNMVSFEMTRVWEEVKQAKKQLRDASEGVTRDESLSNEVEKLRSELGQVREELTRVRKDGKRDLEAGLGGVRNELEGVRQGVVGETGEDIAKLQEEMESVREKVKGVLKEIEQPRKGARNSDADEAPAKTENIARADCDALEELRSRISVLESGTTGRAIVLKGEVGEGSSLALRTQQIEADLANLRQEMSGLQATVAGVRNHSEKGVESCREEVSNVRKEAEDLRGLVNLQGNVTKQVEALRQELEQGLAGSDARVSKLEREMRASERALAQKLAHLRGADGERLDDVGERLPSPAAEKAEAVASASKRTEDQLARVEERIGMMLGLVSKGQQDDRSSLEAAIPNNPLDVPQAVLALRERLELLENRTSETAPLVAGLADRLGAVETALRELREANDSENKAFGNGGPFESGRSASETDGKGSTARAQRGAEPASSLEERLELLEQILILETGASDLRGVLNPNPLSPKSAKPLSPRSPNPVLSPKPLNAKSPRGQQPAAADAKPRLASVERRLGGLEARLDALASNEATGAAALAETRARVQGLDKRVQGLHRNVDLEAQLSKRVAAAEWRLEQVASLVIANTRALEAQVERAQEDSTLAKDAADLASGKCGALAAELVKLSKQLTGGTKERRCAATAS